MKRQTSLISLLASLAVLAPRAGLGATSVTHTENLSVIGNTGELAVESFQLAQISEHDPYLLSRIAVVLAKVGQFDRALEISGTITDEGSVSKDSALRGIAVTLAEAGEIDRALDVAQTVTDFSKTLTLSEIGIALVEAGNVDRALDIAQTITDWSKAFALSKIAVAYRPNGRNRSSFRSD